MPSGSSNPTIVEVDGHDRMVDITCSTRNIRPAAYPLIWWGPLRFSLTTIATIWVVSLALYSQYDEDLSATGIPRVSTISTSRSLISYNLTGTGPYKPGRSHLIGMAGVGYHETEEMTKARLGVSGVRTHGFTREGPQLLPLLSPTIQTPSAVSTKSSVMAARYPYPDSSSSRH